MDKDYAAALVVIKSALLALYVLLANGLNAIGLQGNSVYLSLSVLLAIDYVTGLFKASALKQSIKSNKMKYGLISKLVIFLVPIVFALGSTALGRDPGGILDISLTILILSEIYSILGNIYSIRSGKEMPEYDAISAIGNKLRDFLISKEGSNDKKR